MKVTGNVKLTWTSTLTIKLTAMLNNKRTHLDLTTLFALYTSIWKPISSCAKLTMEASSVIYNTAHLQRHRSLLEIVAFILHCINIRHTQVFNSCSVQSLLPHSWRKELQMRFRLAVSSHSEHVTIQKQQTIATMVKIILVQVVQN